jgi:aminopeptidase
MSSATVSAPAFASLSFDEKLDRLAEVAVRVGLGLRAGQELVLTAPIEALPLVRRITDHAYRAGALLVTTLLQRRSVRAVAVRACAGRELRLCAGVAAGRDCDGVQERRGAAWRLRGEPGAAGRAGPGEGGAGECGGVEGGKPAMELITRHEINWTIVAAATPEWAKLVFPGEPVDEAVAKLWEAIFQASRITGDDPVADWLAHGARLKQRVDLLNAKRFCGAALQVEDGSTDLTVGLADEHLWAGGGTTAGNGVYCQPNIPTEECFTTPHKDRVDGVVRASKPLSHQGTLIENIRCGLRAGRLWRRRRRRARMC